MEWYPEKLAVLPEGTTSTIEFLKENFSQDESFNYAEFGIYQGATALAIAEHFANAKLFLFDYEIVLAKYKSKFIRFFDRVQFFGNSEKFQDSYNWSLSELIKKEPTIHFDYIFIDGAHTFAIDALTFFMCKSLMKPGSYIDFDDYDWKLQGSSLDPSNVPAISLQYTQEQIEDLQVKRVIDQFVRKDLELFEVVQNKIFRKSYPSNEYSIETTMSTKEVDYLTKLLSKSKSYLEFGSGFSTLLASQFYNLSVLSFETDLGYIEFIKKKLEHDSSSSRVELIHLDIGPTKEWGWPAQTEEFKIFPNYVMSFLGRTSTSSLAPDLILIDGRFRISTFLACCLSFPGSKILFDDYLERENYHIVEEILTPIKLVGRIGEFRVPRQFNRRKLKRIFVLLARHAYDPR